MPWVSVEDRLPPLDVRVPVAGDHIPMDEQGRFKYGCGYATRRLHPATKTSYWSSDQW